ncbi:hypothetical protein GGQ02_002504 [Salinibacter ruber]|uniref:hypothetical protein n=1 Tax=Salinibacter ruber TaxID=146919 RepID=UPI0021673CDB|nr:hypothetical protein [Salinibacter ruber]MCS4034104.1 hypothetical protein [Salinibacter ruber]
MWQLGIDHRRAGTWIAPFGNAGSPANPIVKTLMDVHLPPFPEMIIDSLTEWEFLRERSSLADAFHQAKHSVKEFARIKPQNPEAIKNRFGLFHYASVRSEGQRELIALGWFC